MFSGIVEESARVVSFSGSEPYRLVISSSLDHSETALGDSICTNGVCLTVVKIEGPELHFDLAAETVRRSNLGDLKAGDAVNLERSLKIGDRVHGHFVFGHVDSTVKLIDKRPDGECTRLEFELPAKAHSFVVEKGSVSLNGTSLTVGEVTEESFSVYIVPHTDEVTTTALLQVGDLVNLEYDMLARYVINQLAGTGSSKITTEFLKEHGYG